MTSDSTIVRWTTTDRGFRRYEPAEGHEVYESSAASGPHLWVDGEHMTVEDATALRDALPAGLWRDTLTTAIDRHYQKRLPTKNWTAGDPCECCGSTDTHEEDGVAFCGSCGARDNDAS